MEIALRPNHLWCISMENIKISHFWKNFFSVKSHNGAPVCVGRAQGIKCWQHFSLALFPWSDLDATWSTGSTLILPILWKFEVIWPSSSRDMDSWILLCCPRSPPAHVPLCPLFSPFREWSERSELREPARRRYGGGDVGVTASA